MNAQESVVEKVSLWAIRLLAVICVLVPFHAFLTIWAGNNFGGYTAWRLWAESLLVPLTAAAVWLLAHDKKVFDALRRSSLMWCIAGYVGLHLLLGAWALATDRVNGVALGDALALNLRLVALFFVAQVFAARSEWLQVRWRKVVLIPAAVVVVFGLLQIFVLPVDFLRHFGYGAQTIMPYETVDQKLDYVRIQSTVRGANPLGAYLVIVVAALATAGWKLRKSWMKVVLGLSTLATFVVLTYTYSRSAYIGVAIALVAVVWWLLRSKRLKQLALISLASFVVVGTILTLVLRTNDRFENTFFHTDEHSQSEVSSNESRLGALKDGVRDVVEEPLGGGPGTAGPASAHNDKPAQIAENYYLQITQEVGVIGLGLFVAINLLIAQQLWLRRSEPLPRMLLASLLGITAINMLSHAWTDITLAVIWWTLAGAVLAPQPKSKAQKA